MIAEPPISDVRAKAEARRAKTLAREAARISAAKGEKVNTSQVQNDWVPCNIRRY